MEDKASLLFKKKSCLFCPHLQDLNDENQKTTQDNTEQAHKLQVQLHSLTETDVVINHIKTEHAEILTNPETSINREKIRIVELLEVIINYSESINMSYVYVDIAAIN